MLILVNSKGTATNHQSSFIVESRSRIMYSWNYGTIIKGFLATVINRLHLETKINKLLVLKTPTVPPK